MTESRTYNSIRNSSMAVLAQFVCIILNFIGRTFFIKLLNIDYLGVNGLFSNIISLLSLAELGIGTSIVYMMYAPIAKGDVEKVAAFNNLFRKVYTMIGILIFVLGLLLLPFLPLMIKEVPNIKENLSLIYVLFLTNTTVSYFFTYKRSLLIAHQKEYLNSKNVIYYTIIKDIALIVILLLTRNYYYYLITQIIVTLLSNWSISKIADKEFPYIVNKKGSSITNDEKNTLVKNTMGLVCHKIGSVIVSGTDNLLISMFVGIGAVGVYSNYIMIQNVAKKIIGQAVNSVTASMGNLAALEDSDRVYKVFKKIYFINFTLSFFVSVLFYGIVDSFISLWIGHDYLLDNLCVFLISLNLFFYQIRVPSQVVINSYGVFWQIKWKSLIEAIINLLVSILFVYYFNYGIKGILVGTIASTVLTNLWWEPYGAIHYGMKKSIHEYMLFFIYNVFSLAISLGTVYLINKLLIPLFDHLVLKFLVQVSTTIIISVIMFFIFYHKNSDLHYLINAIKDIVSKR